MECVYTEQINAPLFSLLQLCLVPLVEELGNPNSKPFIRQIRGHFLKQISEAFCWVELNIEGLWTLRYNWIDGVDWLYQNMFGIHLEL
jgi:hypothetical protein